MELKNNPKINKLYNSTANKKIKYIALCIASLIVVLQLVLIVRIDTILDRTRLILEGCIGLLAIIFVIIVAILIYRVNSAYINEKYKRRG